MVGGGWCCLLRHLLRVCECEVAGKRLSRAHSPDWCRHRHTHTQYLHMQTGQECCAVGKTICTSTRPSRSSHCTHRSPVSRPTQQPTHYTLAHCTTGVKQGPSLDTIQVLFIHDFTKANNFKRSKSILLWSKFKYSCLFSTQRKNPYDPVIGFIYNYVEHLNSQTTNFPLAPRI